MIFAYATDDRTLIVFPDEPAAVSYCERVDVENGVWEFFDANGKPLQAEFSRPNQQGPLSLGPGAYRLLAITAPVVPDLARRLPRVSNVEGRPPFDSLEAIARHLASHSGRLV